jgi:hypothetical protein
VAALAFRPSGPLFKALHPRSNNMIPHIPEELSPRIEWLPFAITGNTMPPRDPEEDEEDDEDEDENPSDEPPVVREPDED